VYKSIYLLTYPEPLAGTKGYYFKGEGVSGKEREGSGGGKGVKKREQEEKVKTNPKCFVSDCTYL